MKERGCVLIGTEGRRLQLFKEALKQRGLREPSVVTYTDLIAGETRLSSIIKDGDIVRIESPGKDFEVERALLRLGAGADSSRELEAQLSLQDVHELVFDRGLILPQRQWYYGWCKTLKMISEQLSESAPHVLMNSADQIAVLFDKVRCNSLLRNAGVKVPSLLGAISNFDELVERMREHNCRRVFVKPAHSSSASGIVAYEHNGRQHIATSTVETVEVGGQVKLYNSRRVRRYSSLSEIKTLIDRLSAHNLFAEKWYPKAGIGGKTFDLRVVVIAGESRHVVVRESRSPFTNLHLLNGRGQLSLVRAALGEERYRAVLVTCQKAASAFPRCLYVGVDVLISSDFKSHVVAEVNAFGDLLPGILFEGASTYECELDAIGLKRVPEVLEVNA